jgi:hypothetical protein
LTPEVRQYVERSRALDPLAPFTYGLAAVAFHALGFLPTRNSRPVCRSSSR